MAKELVNFRLPSELIKALRDKAQSEGITLTEWARRALAASLTVKQGEVKPVGDDLHKVYGMLYDIQQRLDALENPVKQNGLTDVNLAEEPVKQDRVTFVKQQSAEASQRPACPKCQTENPRLDGKRGGSQRWRCRDKNCGKTWSTPA